MTNDKIELVLDVPDDMMRKLEFIARTQGCSVDDLVQSWIDDYAERWKSPAGDGGRG